MELLGATPHACRVPRLQVSRGATELLVSYRTDPPTMATAQVPSRSHRHSAALEAGSSAGANAWHSALSQKAKAAQPWKTC